MMHWSWQSHLVLAAVLTACSGVQEGYVDFTGRVRSTGKRFGSIYLKEVRRVRRSGSHGNSQEMKEKSQKLKQTLEEIRVKGQDKLQDMRKQLTAPMSACTKEGKWPPLDKFDLVISWWTNKKQSDIHPRNASSFLQQSSSSGFENQAEIKYALRSFEKYGLLDHVGTVHLLLDAAVLDKYGAPRFFNYSNPSLRIITDRDLGVENKAAMNGTKWRKFLAMDAIPGLSEYFLWLPDDNIMLRPFNKDVLYSEEKPLLYSYGTYSLGWCNSMGAVGSTHGPVLFHKCALKAVADYYWRSPHALGRRIRRKAIDVPCLYSNAMSLFWRRMGKREHFHSECHTNSKSATSCLPFKDPPLFFNLQGPGVSDEYADGDARDNPGARVVMPHGVLSFFHDQFPQPSRFELLN